VVIRGFAILCEFVGQKPDFGRYSAWIRFMKFVSNLHRGVVFPLLELKKSPHQWSVYVLKTTGSMLKNRPRSMRNSWSHSVVLTVNAWMTISVKFGIRESIVISVSRIIGQAQITFSKENRFIKSDVYMNFV